MVLIAANKVTKRNIDSKFDDFKPIYLMVISKKKIKLLVKHLKYGRKLAALV
jgi:hypothetical protein